MKKGRSLSAVISTALVLWGVWMCLTLSLDSQELLLGAAVSVIIAFSTGGAFTGNLLKLSKPSRLAAAAGYILFFLKSMVLASIDVLLRVISIRVPTRPGIVRARLSLENPRARTMVANSITLTPGTLTVDMTNDSIFVHWISMPEKDVPGKTQEMVDGFAERLEKIFE